MKRAAEGDGFEVREVKRGRGVDVKKVAEMVLVLEGIGRMRGGNLPSELERELMGHAREMLVGVCQDFAPKDVFPKGVVGGVIEDLGFGKVKEERLGFRGSTMSIAEKLLLSKIKFQMKKPEDFALPPPSAPQRLQGATATAFENRGTLLPVRASTQDKPSQVHAPFASRQPAALSPLAPANSTPSLLPYQPPTSEVRASGSNFVASSNPLKESSHLPSARVDRPAFRVDGRPNGSDNRVSMHATQVEGAVANKPGITTQPATSRPLTTQVATGNPPTLPQNVQSNNSVQTPHTRNSHTEIANIIQKVLQKDGVRPLWTPPSRNYMNKALACQTCQSTVTDVDSILICDHCEKGYHLKCLQTANHKGATKGEWHCLRCLSMNRGKPLPPKYGRVMRNQKSVGPSPDKKGETVDVKPNVQTANGNILMHKGPPGTARSLSSQQTSESKFQNTFQMNSNEALSSEGETDDITSGTYPHKISSAAHLIPSEQPADDKRLVTLVPKPLSNSNTVLSMDHLGMQSSGKFPSSEDHCGRFSSQSHPQKELKGDDLGVLRVNHAEASTSTSMSTGLVNSLSGHSSAIDWVGNISEVVGEKINYQSCCINGVVYRLHDYVLIRFGNDKLTPSKLRAMWEDRITKSKWVTINKCYFPSDLPETVGRPCGLESSEVYDSACSMSLDAGLIQGPCDVLPPNKFEAEKERAYSGMEGDYTSRPCFVCKWIYDESKGLFRDVSC